jgi:hypothetical protein
MAWDDIRDAARAKPPQGCTEAKRVAFGYVAFAKLIDEIAIGICAVKDHTITVESLPSFMIVRRHGRDCSVSYDAAKREVRLGGGFSAYGDNPFAYAVPPTDDQISAWAHDIARTVLAYLVHAA